VTGGRGTAWGWITIDAPPASRTWHFAEAAAGKDEHGNTIYDEINDPSKSYGHMSKDERIELGSLLGVDRVHYQGQSVSPDSREYFVDAAENTEAFVVQRFESATAWLREQIATMAADMDKTPLDVFKSWQDYCRWCNGSDQSPIWDEFVRRQKALHQWAQQAVREFFESAKLPPLVPTLEELEYLARDLIKRGLVNDEWEGTDPNDAERVRKLLAVWRPETLAKK
jgi:hypothetical protein